MHDWTLVGLRLEWRSGNLAVELRDPTGETKTLVAHGVRQLLVPRQQEWGPSISVNEAIGPVGTDDGWQSLAIEVQSGDKIIIIAHRFEMP